MTRDDIIRMAREAGAFPELSDTPEKDVDFLRRFASLVREHLLSTEIHSCHADCQRFACVQTRNAVAEEREACARVCDEMRTYVDRHNSVIPSSAKECAAIIRARSNI